MANTIHHFDFSIDASSLDGGLSIEGSDGASVELLPSNTLEENQSLLDSLVGDDNCALSGDWQDGDGHGLSIEWIGDYAGSNVPVPGWLSTLKTDTSGSLTITNVLSSPPTWHLDTTGNYGVAYEVALSGLTVSIGDGPFALSAMDNLLADAGYRTSIDENGYVLANLSGDGDAFLDLLAASVGHDGELSVSAAALGTYGRRYTIVSDSPTDAGVFDALDFSTADIEQRIAVTSSFVQQGSGSGLTTDEHDALMRLSTDLTTERAALLDHLNADVTSRLAGSTYVAPDNSSIGAIKAKTDNLPSQPAAVGSSMVVSDKTGFKLASDGLDAVSTEAPDGVASNVREMFVQTWRRFFGKVTKSSSQLITYADDGITPVTTQEVTDDGLLETQGSAT
jgi:hypothetical protein